MTEEKEDDLTQSMSKVLLNLTREPTLGLHFVCAHARDRAVPQLVEISAGLRDRTNTAQGMALDAEYTADSLRAGLAPALESLRNISKIVAETRRAVSDAASQPDIQVVSSR